MQLGEKLGINPIKGGLFCGSYGWGRGAWGGERLKVSTTCFDNIRSTIQQKLLKKTYQ